MNNQQGGQQGGHQQGGFGQKNGQNQQGKQAMPDKDKNVKQSKDSNKGGSCG